VAPVLTALGEAAYFRIALGVDPVRVLSANWSLAAGWRPAAIVLCLGLAVTGIGMARAVGPLIVKRLPRFA
jgi:sulfoxide reductase heme-binding subunit YedZ